MGVVQLSRGVAKRTRLSDHGVEQRNAVRRDFPAIYGILDSATGFGIVLTVAEAAMSKQRTQFNERFLNLTRIEVRQPESLHAG